jgi:predicted RNA methylase
LSEVLKEHLSYVADARRLARFREAVARSMPPEAVVADVGCGSAVLGLLCLQAGARHVYGVDETAALEVARQSMVRSGRAEQTTFIDGKSSHVSLPEPVDLVICDHVGYFGIDYGLVELMADARRFLKPGGQMIPGRLKLLLAPVGAERLLALSQGWSQPDIPAEYHWLTELAVNNRYAVDFKPEEVLSAPVELAFIDLREEQPAFFSWSVEWAADRDDVVHGLGGWFDCELAHDVWMTNSPLSEQAIERHQIFLPLSSPLPVKAGDVLQATVMIRPSDNLIGWTVRHPASGFSSSHTTWNGDLLGAEKLMKLRPDHSPSPTVFAHALAVVLGYCDGQRTVADIQRQVMEEHPGLFPTPGEIQRFVASVVSGYTQ